MTHRAFLISILINTLIIIKNLFKLCIIQNLFQKILIISMTTWKENFLCRMIVLFNFQELWAKDIITALICLFNSKLTSVFKRLNVGSFLLNLTFWVRRLNILKKKRWLVIFFDWVHESKVYVFVSYGLIAVNYWIFFQV